MKYIAYICIVLITNPIKLLATMTQKQKYLRWGLWTLFVAVIVQFNCVFATASSCEAQQSGGGSCEILDVYPRPCKDMSVVTFYLPNSNKNYKFSIYDIRNNLLKEYDFSRYEAGTHTFKWDIAGLGLRNGMYVCELSNGVEKSLKTLMLIK